MVRFNCTHCNSCYSERRNLWEAGEDGDEAEVKLEQVALAPLEEGEHVNSGAYLDVVRVTGTTSDITGAVAMHFRLICKICSPISVAADSVELVCGSALMYAGFFTPSGLLDTYHVTKAGVTVGVCLTCTVLVACAGSCPVLFVAAICTDVAGLFLGHMVDEAVPGLCPDCTTSCQPDEDAIEEVRVQKRPASQYEPFELLIITVFGLDW
mmetsp:Transcript_86589/g.218063  ORF Transcript_86589/g.218063 Transcript_86589/m.218063 type:complete len:210 (+) Transcript_86589:78-707(+)